MSLPVWSTALLALGYLLGLFGLAWWVERRPPRRGLLADGPWRYTLSLAVFCTAWTFYGSVGRAAEDGYGFLTIYLGPSLAALLWWGVLRKVITAAKYHKLTSVADFLSARFGKSPAVGALVAAVTVAAVLPYIALQLEAIASGFDLLTGHRSRPGVLLDDTAFYASLVLALFAVLFGTRHLDANERHEGLVAAIAFESVVKLLAFLAVGAWVCFVLYRGPGELFARAGEDPRLAAVLSGQRMPPAGEWLALLLLSGLAAFLLPRQFQVAVVENRDTEHLRTATWAFPAYLLLINLFVLPIALAGELAFAGGGADAHVLRLPLAEGVRPLAVLAFLGGLSAASGMVIVSVLALSIMLSNNLLLPLVLRSAVIREQRVADVSDRLLHMRRLGMLVLLLLSYAYYQVLPPEASLVSIGLVSFVGVAQFAPAFFGGLYWKGATRRGALWGIGVGGALWAYLLPLAGLAEAGFLPDGWLERGPFGLAFLRPDAFAGLPADLSPVTRAAFASLLANAAVFTGVSLATRADALELAQAALFVDVYRFVRPGGEARFAGREASLPELRRLMERFLGPSRAEALLREYAGHTGIDPAGRHADARLVDYVERNLAGAIGAASARVVVRSVVVEEPPALEEVFALLDRTREAIRYSRALEQKSRELERTTRELREANARLRDVDRAKAEFLATVTHELRTPVTSIRSFSRILRDTPDLAEAEREEFLDVLVSESVRISRLIDQLLELDRLESGELAWHDEALDLRELATAAARSVQAQARERGATLSLDLPPEAVPVRGDRDQLTRVLLNLLSNALKFVPPGEGSVRLRVGMADGRARLTVADNGPGVPKEQRERVFERFVQGDAGRASGRGSGLGLFIARTIAQRHGGALFLEAVDRGACFALDLPRDGAA